MIEHEMDKIELYAAPPTRKAIDRSRNAQMEALKDLRRQLLDFTECRASAA